MTVVDILEASIKTKTSDGQVAILRSSRSIQEFRLDFFLEEEFSVDASFVRAFMNACNCELTPCGVGEAIHSYVDKFGEADLIILIMASRSNSEIVKAALLIEDKITAPPQPAQAERYRKRGLDGIKNNLWDYFLTVLVAPATYIPADGGGYDVAISLEQIKEWIAPSDLARRAFKLKKLDEAIAKKNTSGVQIVDQSMTDFHAAYYNYLQEFNTRRGTDFTMRQPKPTYYGDTWFIMRSNQLPAWAEIRHMSVTGNIGIDFKDVNFEKLSLLEFLIAETNIELLAIGKHGQHATLRLQAPKIAQFNSFESEQFNVEAALLNAEQIWRLYQQERTNFEDILIPARTK